MNLQIKYTKNLSKIRVILIIIFCQKKRSAYFCQSFLVTFFQIFDLKFTCFCHRLKRYIQRFMDPYLVLNIIQYGIRILYHVRTVPYRTAAFLFFRNEINFSKSVYRTVPRSIQNFKSANRTVKNAFVFPFFYKKRETSRI